jgi:hypothetical protein
LRYDADGIEHAEEDCMLGSTLLSGGIVPVGVPRVIRSIIRSIIPGVVLAFCLGCSGVDVSRHHDPDYDFSQLQTWNFLDATPERTGVDEVTLGRIQTAIEHELTAKGYQRSDTPDFGVAVHGGRDTQMDVEGHAYDWEWRGNEAAEAYEYDVGTLTLDIVDLDTQKRVWRGVGTAIIGRDDPKSATNRINAAVGKMLSPFPPGR